MSKHTPGPWTIGEENPIEIWGADSGKESGHPLVCTIPAPHGNYIADADARLIAAAPALRDALRACMPSACQATHFSSPNYDGGKECGKCGYCLAKSALAACEPQADRSAE